MLLTFNIEGSIEAEEKRSALGVAVVYTAANRLLYMMINISV